MDTRTTSGHKLTKKQKAFADTLLANKKISARQAALATYGKPGKPTTPATATQIAMENLSKPSVLEYLADHARNAEETLIDVMNTARNLRNENPNWANVARQSASDVLDRTHGKATQRVETASTSVTINLDLTNAP